MTNHNKVNMERSTECRKEKSTNGPIITRAHHPPGTVAPRSSCRVTNRPNPTPTIYPLPHRGNTILTKKLLHNNKNQRVLKNTSTARSDVLHPSV